LVLATRGRRLRTLTRYASTCDTQRPDVARGSPTGPESSISIR
jgi:hypothetical protein